MRLCISGVLRDEVASHRRCTDALFNYVFAVALANAGQVQAAIGVLEVNLTHHNNDVASLQALNQYLAQTGQSERARELRLRLDGLLRQ